MTVEAPRVPTDDRSDDGAPAGRSSRVGRVVVIVVVCALVSMWGYVLYLAFGPGRQPPIDRLDDPAFAEALATADLAVNATTVGMTSGGATIDVAALPATATVFDLV